MMGIGILEGIEELRLIGGTVPGDIGHIGLPVRREGELGLLGGNGDLTALVPGHETVGHSVVIGAEDDIIITGGKGHLIEMILHGGTLEIG